MKNKKHLQEQLKLKPLFEKNPEDYAIKELLRPHKTIRDAIHGDIMVTKLEVFIMDTKEFQRLHNIRQIGMAYRVYPSANHTRFEHSLGTLYMAQCLMELALKNPHKDPRVKIHVNTPDINIRFPSECQFSEAVITNYHVLLLRICALLHDLSHIPFGHTLEDEGFLFDAEWEDKGRVRHFLRDDSTIAHIIITKLNSEELNGKKFMEDVRSVLTSKKDEIANFPFPFICDIINNTICADLLDYVKRDMFFCGLKETYDERFLTYFYISMHEDKPRLLLRLIKPTTGLIRRDVLSETLHLLRLRYSLGEKVYNHHTKVCASAMIISAVQSAMKNRLVSLKKLYEIGDDELINLLKEDHAGGYIIGKLEKREFYKPVYKLKYKEVKLDDAIAQKQKDLIEELHDNNRRYNHNRALEIMSDVKPGQIIVYCPGPEMGQKVVRTLVNFGQGDPGQLNNIEDNDIRNEIKLSIEDKHLRLWNMFVFVDPAVSKATMINIACDCSKHFDLQNEIEDAEYHLDRPSYGYRFKERAEEELGCAISSSIHNKIITQVGRATGKERLQVISYEEYKKQIEQHITSKNEQPS